MKRFGRYDRSVIFWIITVVSISGMALISSPKSPGKYMVNMDISMALEELVEYTLNTGFESSLSEIELRNDRIPFTMEVKKGFRIDNRLVDIGLVYHVKVDENFNREHALRNLLTILSDNYLRIRRENISERINGKLTSVEEKGLVNDGTKNYTYINKVIWEGDEAWLFVLAFEEVHSEKVQDFLDSIWIGNEKGVTLS